jgi:hypothetical protein
MAVFCQNDMVPNWPSVFFGLKNDRKNIVAIGMAFAYMYGNKEREKEKWKTLSSSTPFLNFVI